MAELGSILLRRGTTAERLKFVPLKGEIIYDTELKQVFVGDGETYGGISVFNDAVVVDTNGDLKVGDNVAVILGDDGLARSLRLPGGLNAQRPAPLKGGLRFNSQDKVLEFSDGEEWFFLDKNVITGDVIELHVSLDGTDSRRYGAQRGRSWGTAFRTINAAMRLAEDIVNARPETEPFVNEEQPYRQVQVLVKVASGIYEEHLPIRVPTNTSIFGSGQRRTTVRPKAGVVSQSPWAKVRFWRETDEYPDGYFGFHYLTDASDEFSTPKDNTDIDIFLCNDTNWFHDFGTDLHNSFCFVLDPEGQILTKSPYPHTGVCFAKSSYNTDPYAVGFHGGMFADGFTGNQDFNVDIVESDGAMIASGFYRKPNMPTAFYIDGVRYQADSVESDGLGEEDAAELLSLNKEFIQEETIQFVNDKYIFNYNRDKCRRDLDKILRNVSYDNVLGTNFLTHLSATSYLRPNSAYVLSDQRPETAGGINYAKGQANTSLTSHTASQTKNTQLFNSIIDTINNQTIPEIYWPATVYNDEKDAIIQILSQNIPFIKAELTAWINYQINNSIAPFASFSYDIDKCKRDTEFVVNALIFDLIYGGNFATIEIANSYWLGITSQVPTQQEQHLAAYNRLKIILGVIFTNDESIEWNDKYQLDVPQVIVPNVETVTQTKIDTANALVTIVGEVISYGTNYAPLTEYPSITDLFNATPPLLQTEFQKAIDARTVLVTDTTDIINSTIAFIDTAYASFTYDEATCRRDVGLLIDAMRHDLIYGGEIETVKAGKTYFETGSTVIADQEAETVDAINYARDLAINVVNNSVPSKVYQSTITQIQDSNYQSGVDINTRLTDLFGIVTNVISNYSNIKAAHDLLESNKVWIQDEVDAFIADQYPALVYNVDLCRRDTGLIISAISNDLFGGSARSEEAGRKYYRNVSDLGDPSVAITTQLTETLAANAHAKYLIYQVLSNATPATTYQSVSSQTFDLTISVSSTLKDKTQTDFDKILSIMEFGIDSVDTSLPKFKVNINDSTPIPSSIAGRGAEMITAGNKSFVATDWTMFGNLGYGVLARNNARCELVSIFTYYCGYTYKAESGSEIRSLNGSSSNGIYGLGAEGRNPFEVPVRATTLSETVFIAEADSTVVGDNVLGDLQIVVRNAVDVNGDPATFFNVMVAEVDHGLPTGIVRYEIGNFQGNTLNIRGSAQGLLADIPDGNDINIRLLQEYKVSADQDISQLLLGAALLYDDEPDTGYRIINIDPVGSDFVIRTIPSINHFSVVANGVTAAGNTDITINNINYTEDEILDRRIGYKGTIYTVTAYDGATTLTVTPALTDDVADLQSLRLSPQPGLEGDIFTDFSIVKAGNHDMLDIGTGAYEDSNYPRELYGPPARTAVQTQEVNETAPGRVFFVTNDQDGNFRVGDYFRVNQGDGSISFNAAIALSNLDGLGFSRGVTINEFSADSDMSDISDEAVPTEQAVVNYINKRLGQEENGATVGAQRLGAGTLMLDGSQAMEGNIDMDGNDIVNLGVLNVTDITANSVGSQTLDIDVSATLASANVEDLTPNRIVVAGTAGELQDYAELTFDGNTLTVVSSSSTTALDVTGTVNFTGEFNLDGDLYPSGNIIPTLGDVWSLGTQANPWAELYLGPGSLYINGKKVISDETDEITISTAVDQNIRITANGSGQITLASDTTVTGLTANDITVDDIVIDDNNITINGNIIRGTGSASSGTITFTPGFTGSNLGSVQVIGDLSVTGTFSTTETTLTNQTITGNLEVQGNTTIGTDSNDNVTFEANLNSDIIPNSDGTFDLGTNNLRFQNVYTELLDTDSIIVNASGDISVYDSTTPTPVETFAVDGATGNVDIEGNFTINNEGNFTVYDNSTPTPLGVFNVNGTSGTTFIRKGGIFRIYENDPTPAIMFEASGSTGDVYIKNDVDIDGDVDIAGNLTVGGTVLSDLSVEDNTIILNSNYTGDPSVTGTDAGIEVERGTGTNVSVIWNETADKWQLTNDGSTYDDIALAGDVSVAAGDSRIDSASFNTSDGVLTLTRGDATTATVDLDGRFVIDTGDTMTGNLNFNTTATGLTWSMNTDGASIKFYNTGDSDTNSRLEFQTTDNNNEYFAWTHAPSGGSTYELMRLVGSSSSDAILTLNGKSIIFEGNTPDAHETTITVTEPTADRTITFKDADGTVAFTSDIQDGTITITAGTYLSNGEVDSNFTTNQSSNQTITINHDATTRTNTSDSASVGFAGTFDIVDSISTNATGHVTGVNVKTITLPSEADTLDTVADRGNTTNQILTTGGLKSDTLTTNSANTDLTLSGNGTGVVYVSDTLKTTSITTGAAATAGTITGNWTLTTGSKFEATYADVAEIYATDEEYEPGTVVMFGGDVELTIAVGWGTTKVAGVITTNPAFVMNNMADGQPIALKGRIPVKVEGRVSKGDFIIASNTPGVGVATDKYIGGAIIGKAIEDKDTDGIELIEVKV